MPKPVGKISIQPRFRLLRGKEIAFGPGKALLLEKIAETGSIAKAAKKLDMSYMRAWLLLKTMEKCFNQPLVELVRGGKKGGGAQLTSTGLQVIKIYRDIENKSIASTKILQKQLFGLLKD